MNSIYAVQKIYLMMGAACNLKCRHCYQMDNPQPHLHKQIHSDVWDFLDRMSLQKPEKLNLVFWGGEPLLYWPLIKSVIDRFDGRFNFAFISNGTLLNDAMVDYLNAHNVLFSVSCDGPLTTKVRGINILDDPAFCARFKRLNRRCIGTTIHAYNIDPFAFERFVKERVGETNIHYQYTLECTWEMDRDLYEYDFETYEEHLKTCRKLFIEGAVKGDMTSIAMDYLKRGVLAVMGTQTRADSGIPDRWWPECSSMRKTMNVDIEGYVHLCHNMTSVLGRVTDDYDELFDANDRMLKEKLARKTECDSCSVVRWCRRGCPLNCVADHPGQKICCEAERIYWKQAYLTVCDAAKITTDIAL